MSDSKKKISSTGFVSCEELQHQLPAYMLRELGDKQSRLMREHLRLCAKCRAEAARFEKMHRILRDQQPVAAAEETVLSEKRLRRLRFAALHPFFDWIYYRHRMVSVLCAAILILVVLFVLRNAVLLREPDFGERIPAWQMFRSGELPELVDEAVESGEGGRGE